MLLNYLKVFLRLFARNRVFTLINLLGLSTGITCFVLIRIYVVNETVYDRHLPDAENTYRLAMKGDMSGFSFEAAVMGGDSTRIVVMLLKEYPVLLLIASVFSLPASWYFTKRWLENFAYKTEISVWIYIISVLLVLLICIGTILIQTLRTARANPANALRYE